MSDAAITRLLVAGGAGFIGSAFVRQRLREDPQLHITVLDKLTDAGSEENFGDVIRDGRLRFVAGDICDPATVEPLAKDAESTVNSAAESHVDRSLLRADAFVKTDVEGTYVLLEAARRLGPPAVLAGQHRRGLRPRAQRTQPGRRSATAAQPLLGHQSRRRDARWCLPGEL